MGARRGQLKLKLRAAEISLSGIAERIKNPVEDLKAE